MPTIPDAPLVDRIAQPAFDALFIRFGIPVTLIAVECWLATIVLDVARALFDVGTDLSVYATRLAGTFVWAAFLYVFLRRARSRHKRWTSASVASANAVPTAYANETLLRCFFLGFTVFFAFPTDIQALISNNDALFAILRIAGKATLILALYADACHTLPPSAGQQRQSPATALPAPVSP